MHVLVVKAGVIYFNIFFTIKHMNKPDWCVVCLGWKQGGGEGWARKTQDRLMSVGQKDQYRAEVEIKEEKAKNI